MCCMQCSLLLIRIVYLFLAPFAQYATAQDQLQQLYSQHTVLDKLVYTVCWHILGCHNLVYLRIYAQSDYQFSAFQLNGTMTSFSSGNATTTVAMLAEDGRVIFNPSGGHEIGKIVEQLIPHYLATTLCVFCRIQWSYMLQTLRNC